ncbi:hypothetical protein D3C72_1227990 [compost metagenome]
MALGPQVSMTRTRASRLGSAAQASSSTVLSIAVASTAPSRRSANDAMWLPDSTTRPKWGAGRPLRASS